MCGLIGIAVGPNAVTESKYYRNAVVKLFRLSEPRGVEASGIAVSSSTGDRIFKRAVSPREFLKDPSFRETLDTAVPEPGATSGRSFAVIGHCRLVTNGSQDIEYNNQPINIDGIIGVHNGIVTNSEQIFSQFPEKPPVTETDSEALYKIIGKFIGNGHSLNESVAKSYAEIRGAASVALLPEGSRSLVLATNTGSIYYSVDPQSQIMIFGSERFIVESFLQGQEARNIGLHQPVQHLMPNTGITISYDDFRIQKFILEQPVPHSEVWDAAHKDTELRQGYTAVISQASVPLASADSKVRRCTKCILPATYPLINFDSDGVCNFCRDYQRPGLAGPEALEAVLSQHRRNDGKPDCIVAFSGGRDSSYGLHLLKTEFKMNPLAFTYDWGLVTDLARRNQARLCGTLGVEHVIRTADIAAKRRYIKKNIEAWIKRPSLGMVPLFMAGDKMFYSHARQLRKETNIPLVIFCAGNPLEATDFKVGFCGISQADHREVLYNHAVSHKVRLALWYAFEYCRNPSYFNESFIDSIQAYYATFIGKDDFQYLYHYLPWDEQKINATLAREYDWETSSETDNTWRIGDGYTSFINYIYFAVAGFTEFDSFRSSQVRAGLIERDEALELVAADNEPKKENLNSFAETIDLDMKNILMQIDKIPKLDFA